jgi:sacsin
MNTNSNDLLIESYGQTEPLTTRLNSILRDYPRGPQIFRELLQNADDARASEFCLMLDEREFEKHNLMCNEMEKMQGMSLICYNSMQ